MAKKVKKGLYKFPCGCTATDVAWTMPLCKTHQPDYAETRARWKKEYEELKQRIPVAK